MTEYPGFEAITASGQTIGKLSIHGRREEYDPHVSAWPEISVEVLPDYRGQRLGLAMTAHLVAVARELGHPGVLGVVDRTNANSLKMIARLGVEPTFEDATHFFFEVQL
jgi:L-amino acid N-acyltransferase YncA